VLSILRTRRFEPVAEDERRGPDPSGSNLTSAATFRPVSHPEISSRPRAVNGSLSSAFAPPSTATLRVLATRFPRSFALSLPAFAGNRRAAPVSLPVSAPGTRARTTTAPAVRMRCWLAVAILVAMRWESPAPAGAAPSRAAPSAAATVSCRIGFLIPFRAPLVARIPKLAERNAACAG
jgi:hypothetical protein